MEHFKDIASSREASYAFLTDVFMEELKEARIQEYIESGAFEALNELGSNIDIDFFKNKPLHEVEEELAVEYSALFIGPGTHTPPYESIYVPDESGRSGLYWGDCTIDMKNWVEHYGLEISKKFESIPDHISIELQFMQKMIEQERLAWERDDKEEAEKFLEAGKTFFNKHLIKWVPDFCDEIIKNAHLDFYREIALLTKKFIKEEEELLNNVKVQ